MVTLQTKEDLTPFTLSKIFSNYYDTVERNDQIGNHAIHVDKIHSIHSIQTGHISQVMEVNMETTTTTTTTTSIDGKKSQDILSSSEESQSMTIIAKFQQDVTSSQFSIVECNFFQKYYAYFMSSTKKIMPFSIPKVFYSSDTCLLLERIPNVKQYSLLEKCPKQHIERIIQLLAIMHANCWIGGDDNSNDHCAEKNNNHIIGLDQYSSLSSHPGIGSTLDGITKERLFPNSWNDFVQYNVENSTSTITDEQPTLNLICQDMSNKKLRQIHDYVNHPTNNTTLIHGDFHLANILIQNKKGKRNDNPIVTNSSMEDSVTKEQYEYWLIDWATCGRGNPMKDFIFFILLSTEAAEDNDEVIRLLRLYHTSLLSSSQNVTSKEYSWETCVKSYQYGIVNQFLILVAYDHFSREMAKGNDVLRNHFLNVNRRCLRSLLSPIVNVQKLMEQISKKSANDLKEEKDAIRNNTLKVSL